MLGSKSGAVQRLRDFTKRQFLVGVHCNGHKLELAFKDSLKSNISFFNKVELLLLNLYYFYRNSNVTRNGLKDSYRSLGVPILLPVRIGGTRWLSHLKSAVEIFIKGYDAFSQHLGQLQNSKVSRTDRGNKALGFYVATKSKDVFLFVHFLLDVLVILANISKKFQEKTCHIQDILLEIDLAIKALEKLQTRDGFYLRQALSSPKLLDLKGDDRSFVSARQKLPYVLICALNKRFTENPGVVKHCSAFSLPLFPASVSDAKEYGDDDIDVLTDYFKEALETSGTEADKIAGEWIKLKELIFQKFDNPSKASWSEINRKLGQVCPNLLQLVDLVLTIPASSADAERGFSRIKNTKTEKRTRLLDLHLSDQMMIMMESADVGSYDPSPAINLWNLKSIRRITSQEKVVPQNLPETEKLTQKCSAAACNSMIIDIDHDDEHLGQTSELLYNDNVNAEPTPSICSDDSSLPNLVGQFQDNSVGLPSQFELNETDIDFMHNKTESSNLSAENGDIIEKTTRQNVRTSDKCIQVDIFPSLNVFESEGSDGCDLENYISDDDYCYENNPFVDKIYEPKLEIDERTKCAKAALCFLKFRICPSDFS